MDKNDIYYIKNQKKLGLISLTHNKFTNKSNTRKKISNNRYQNLLESQNFNSPRIYNNNIIYQSFNKNGYNGIVNSSLSGNNNILIVNDSDKDIYSKLKNSSTKKRKILNKSANNKLDKEKNLLPFNKEKNSYFEPKELLDSRTIFSKKNPSTVNSSNWNNIGFTEIKYKNNFGVLSYNPDSNIKNKLLYKSYQQLSDTKYSGPNAKNIGFLIDKDNLFSSYNPNNSNTKYNINNYSSYINNDKSPLYNNEQNKNLNYRYTYNSRNGNELMRSYFGNINKNNIPDYLGSGEIDNDNINLKNKNRFTVNNTNLRPKNILSSSYNTNLISNNGKKTTPIIL